MKHPALPSLITIQISIQRTGEGSSIGAFINYTDQQGILLNSYFKRINAKLAYDDKPTDWLSTSVNLLVNHTWGNRTSDNPYGQGALRTMIEQLPFLPVKLDGEYTQTNIINTSSILNNRLILIAETRIQPGRCR